MGALEICELTGVSITFIAVVVAAISLIALFRQTRENSKQTRLAARASQAAAYHNIVTAMSDIERLFFENPELRPYFYDDKELDHKGKDADRVCILAEMFVDFMDNAMVQSNLLESYEWTGWEDYFRDIYKSSPAIRSYWREHRQWYSDLLGGVLDPLRAAYILEQEDG